MQIPIVNGIYASSAPDIRTSYPVNMEPIPKASGLSDGYLRTAEGLDAVGTGPGVCRGGIEWNGQCFRVMGAKFGRIDGTSFVEIGTVNGSGPVTLDYGFAYLAIASDDKLFLYDGITFAQVTDGDLGLVKDVAWIDGYYITTDGEFITSTELANPFEVRPFKYASSEEDSDPVLAVKKLGTELYAINRHTIEAFTNIGGTGFPFQVIDGTQTFRGAIGTHAVTDFMGSLAFLGSGRKESPGVYMMTGGGTAAISTSEIEKILSNYTEQELQNVVCEARQFDRRNLLYVHLDDQTLVYDGSASAALGQPVWMILKTGDNGYRGRYFVWCDSEWSVADTQLSNFGIVTDTLSTHWGESVSWEFSTPTIFADATGLIVHEVELTGVTGVVLGENGASMSLSFTEDGVNYSQTRNLNLGPNGSRALPMKWTRVGYCQNKFSLKFRGDSNSRISVARLDARLEKMAW